MDHSAKHALDADLVGESSVVPNVLAGPDLNGEVRRSAHEEFIVAPLQPD
jgi:hypothetical protein